MGEKYNNKYRVDSLRLRNWDYGCNASYFITICTFQMKHYFGRISGGHMIYNPIGMIAKEWWCEIPKYFPWIRLEEFVIMPNHIHGIIVFNKDENPRRDAINRVSTGGVTGDDNPMRKNNLARIIRWYKGRTSFEIHKIAKSF